MKTFIGFILTLVFFASCSTETEPVVEQVDFSGIYTLMAHPGDCVGTLVDMEEPTQIIIAKVEASENEYMLEFEDDLFFPARQEDKTLIVDAYTANEGQGFDEVTLSGIFTYLDSKSLDFKFSVSVIDDGESDCELVIVKE